MNISEETLKIVLEALDDNAYICDADGDEMNNDQVLRAESLLREEMDRGGWQSIADGEPPMSRVLAAREVNGRRYVDVVSWITEPDSGLPRLNPTLSQITHWMPLPEPPEVT